MKTKQKVDKSYRGGDTFAEPDFEKRPCQLLYRDANGLHFMDQENYEQFSFQEADLEWECKFLKDEMENGKSGDFLAKFNEAAMTRWASDHKAKFVAKCIKTADVSPAPSTSALSHGMLVSGVIGGVAYAFM